MFKFTDSLATLILPNKNNQGMLFVELGVFCPVLIISLGIWPPCSHSLLLTLRESPSSSLYYSSEEFHKKHVLSRAIIIIIPTCFLLELFPLPRI